MSMTTKKMLEDNACFVPGCGLPAHPLTCVLGNHKERTSRCVEHEVAPSAEYMCSVCSYEREECLLDDIPSQKLDFNPEVIKTLFSAGTHYTHYPMYPVPEEEESSDDRGAGETRPLSKPQASEDSSHNVENG